MIPQSIYSELTINRNVPGGGGGVQNIVCCALLVSFLATYVNGFGENDFINM